MKRMSLLDGGTHVLFAHAHPDDETLATGALIAELVARGVTTTVVTATRGEAGEIVAGVLPPETTANEFVAVRERELYGALEVLGVSHHCFLGTPPARAGDDRRIYRDSGMTWVTPTLAGPADASDESSFTAQSPSDEAADLGECLGMGQPGLVVSYDDIGGYGHPDHVRMREVALAASRLAGIPFAEIVLGEADGDDVEWFDLPQHQGVVERALQCYRTQLTVDGTHIVHVGGQDDEMTLRVGLRLVP